MTKINLAELAAQANERYKDVECSFGEIRVYHVPVPLIWSLKPDWYPPQLPQVEMRLASGQFQRRTAKAGDPKYHEWQQANSRWEQEKDDIQTAGRYVMALRDVEYPADLSYPPAFLIDYLNGHYPDNDLLRKKIWLDATILSRGTDLAKIMAAIMELGNVEAVTAEDVDEAKKNSESDLEEMTLPIIDQEKTERTQ